KERDEALPLDQASNFLPLVEVRVNASGVVTTGVQHHNRALGQRTQGADHALVVEPAGCGIVIRVGFYRKACAFKQSAVVFPAWVADDDFGVGLEPFEEIGADFKGACTAQRLCCQSAAGSQQRAAV